MLLERGRPQYFSKRTRLAPAGFFSCGPTTDVASDEVAPDILRAQADRLRRAAGDILPGRQAVGRDYLRCRGFQRADVGLPSLPDHALN